MRKLSLEFMEGLEEGHLAPLRNKVCKDRDLILEIREDALNIYYKGHSLLKLSHKGDRYGVALHEKFQVQGIRGLTHLDTPAETDRFVRAIPEIKEQIVKLGPVGNEIEYEQMLVRANNCEPDLNTEYFIIDRQCVTADGKARFDLMAIHWPVQGKRRRGQEVALALLEVKFSLNPDIGQLHKQLSRYYGSVAADVERISHEAQTLLRQKIDLGLFNQSPNRMKALRTLTISRRIEDVRFVVVLVDYNPHSGKLDTDALGQLCFAKQIDLFHVGYGLWDAKCVSVLKDGDS